MYQVQSDRWWLGVVGFGAISIVVFLFAPGDSVWQLVAFFAPLVVAVGMLASRVLGKSLAAHGPHYALLGSVVVYLVTTLVWYLGPTAFGVVLPFPSLVDVFYFVAYSGFAVFMVMVLRRRARDDKRESRIALTDSLIFTVSVSSGAVARGHCTELE
jgi:hypothetical protein